MPATPADPVRSRASRAAFALALASALAAVVPCEAPAAAPRIEVVYTPDISQGPLSARVYVMFGPVKPVPKLDSDEPRLGPNWLRPQPFYAVDAKDWKPGEPLAVGPDAVSFPKPMADLVGEYKVQAVIRLNPDTHRLGDGEGNLYGPATPLTVRFDPKSADVKSVSVRLVVEVPAPPRRFAEIGRLKFVEVESPLLSAFYHRPVKQRAAVILPAGDLSQKRGALYVVPGFGGDVMTAPRMLEHPETSPGKDLIRVVLDPDCFNGHHVFADSATNGPRGRALVEEFIPHIEKNFPVIAEPGARLLNGHSSGGWSSLWLQVTYPDVFGGVWSTSPDPVDFRDFQRIDLYAPNANMYTDPAGARRPLARRGNKPVLFYENFARMERVIGDGGQLHSFEAVFSPLTPAGRPRELWDRATGAVDTETAKSWEPYDIRRKLERNWPTLGPKLKGKVRVVMGDLDTFYLEGAVKLLKASLESLGSDAAIEIVPGRDHRTVIDAPLAARFDREMNAAVAGRPAR